MLQKYLQEYCKDGQSVDVFSFCAVSLYISQVITPVNAALGDSIDGSQNLFCIVLMPQW